MGSLLLDGEPPKYGAYGIFDVDYYPDTYDHITMVTGFGDTSGEPYGLILLNNRYNETVVNFSQPVVVDGINWGYEPLMGQSYDKLELLVEGFDGTDWIKLGDIPHIITSTITSTYLLPKNDLSLTSLRIRSNYGIGDGLLPCLLTDLRFRGNIKFANAQTDTVDAFKYGVESVCATPVSENGRKIPTVNSSIYGIAPTLAQPYVVHHATLKGLYRQLPAAPSNYPYSTRLLTDDNIRIELNMAGVSKVDMLSLGNVRVAFSFDNRNTWVVYSGGTWVTFDIMDEVLFRSSGMTDVEISAIPGSAFSPYIGAGNYVDVAVLLTVESSVDYAYYNTIIFKSTDDNDPGKRIFTPANSWFNILLDAGSNMRIRTYDDIVGGKAPYTVNCFDTLSGNHPNYLVVNEADDVSMREAYTKDNVECAWVSLSTNAPLPERSGTNTSMHGGILRDSSNVFLFEYATETLTLSLGGSVGTISTYSYRRSFGNGGKIIMNYSSDGTAAHQEVYESTVGTLYTLSDTVLKTPAGFSCALASDDYAWLPPGYINSTSNVWYMSTTKVDYSTTQNYANQRCTVPAATISGVGGVSNKLKGWMVYSTPVYHEYEVISLDYSNDIAGFISRSKPIIGGASSILSNDTIGCSCNTLNSGLFLLSHMIDVNSSAQFILKIDYANDTTHRTIRTDNTVSGIISPYRVNPQARSLGTYSMYFWTINADFLGPLAIDQATETVARRFRGVKGSNMKNGHQCCGSESSGLSY
jgi:hypothetical protein